MNPFEMVKNFGNIKESLENAQESLRQLNATGSAGGNMVKVTINGKFELLDIQLDPICVDNRDIPMLQDLIKAAHHDAMDRMQELIHKNAGSMFAGIDIPGMNL